MSGLLDSFMSAVKANPSGIAIVEPGGQYTFAEVADDVERICATLRQRANGDAVGILLPNSEKYVAALLGIWKAGKTAVPLNHLLPDFELAFIIQNSELSTLIAAKSTT
jgi:acyl-CoA synthetase (AMP-forming)/AMP-acid ligase II